MVKSSALVALAILVFSPAVFVQPAPAAIIPLRSGAVISKVDAGGFTYIKAVDDAGKKFWILTTLCIVGEQGRIAVLTGTHYEKVISDHLEATLEDLYTAQLLKIGDLEIAGFGAHGLPAGCAVLE